MTAAFFERDSLYEQACLHFNIPARTVSGRKPDGHDKKRRQVSTTLEKFRQVMSGPNPPRTQQQAVEAVAPLLALILSAIFKTLAVQLIEWLWEQTQEIESTN